MLNHLYALSIKVSLLTRAQSYDDDVTISLRLYFILFFLENKTDSFFNGT